MVDDRSSDNDKDDEDDGDDGREYYKNEIA